MADPGRNQRRSAADHTSIGELLRDRAWRRWTLSSFLARLPITMALIGLVVAGEASTG